LEKASAMNKRIAEIYDSLQEVALYFGSRGINGECCDNLSFIEFMAIKKAQGRTGLAIQDLGRTLNMTKSGATRIVDRLESKGYLARKISPRDGRVCCVKCTLKGTKAVTKAAAKYAIRLEKAFQELEPHKIEQIGAVLKTLIQAVQKSRQFKSAVNAIS